MTHKEIARSRCLVQWRVTLLCIKARRACRKLPPMKEIPPEIRRAAEAQGWKFN